MIRETKLLNGAGKSTVYKKQILNCQPFLLVSLIIIDEERVVWRVGYTQIDTHTHRYTLRHHKLDHAMNDRVFHSLAALWQRILCSSVRLLCSWTAPTCQRNEASRRRLCESRWNKPLVEGRSEISVRLGAPQGGHIASMVFLGSGFVCRVLCFFLSGNLLRVFCWSDS